MCNECTRCRQSTKSYWFRFVTVGASYLEIANVEFLGVNGQVGRFSHVIRAVKPFDQFAVLRDAKHGRTDQIHGHDVTLVVDGQTGQVFIKFCFIRLMMNKKKCVKDYLSLKQPNCYLLQMVWHSFSHCKMKPMAFCSPQYLQSYRSFHVYALWGLLVYQSFQKLLIHRKFQQIPRFLCNCFHHSVHQCLDLMRSLQK